MAKRWRIRPHDAERITQLQQAAGVPHVVAQLLLCRGIDDESAARAFLDTKLNTLHDPAELPGAAVAAERIASAIREREPVTVYGDYDADGMTATSILVLCLRLLGGTVREHVPNRMDEGYGLNCDALEKIAATGTRVVVTVDCGIGSVAEAERAQELGLELIITDHHEFGAQLPPALAVVHPRLPGHDYPFGGLCGAGVAFKLAWAVCQALSETERVGTAQRNFLLQAMGLAAIGTVADVVPLVDENRVLVRHGLTSLAQRPTVGLRALMRITELDQKPHLEAEDIAFTIAPRLNAAGRLGQAELGVELLTTTSEERAAALADYIHQLNQSRMSLERSVYLAAHKQAQHDFDPEHDPALVLAGHGWHAGVIGIVAGRLCEKFHRPVALISLDAVGVKPGLGSARSVPGQPLHTALAACGDHLLSHGGHAAAAGLTIQETEVDSFRAAFCEFFAEQQQGEPLQPELEIDAETPFTSLTQQTVQQIEQLSPFGQGNPRPMLCTSGVKLAKPPQRMGGGGRHVSMTLEQHGQRMRAVAFGKGDWADEMATLSDSLAVAFQPVINRFRGRSSVELHLVDWQIRQDVPVGS